MQDLARLECEGEEFLFLSVSDEHAMLNSSWVAEIATAMMLSTCTSKLSPLLVECGV